MRSIPESVLLWMVAVVLTAISSGFCDQPGSDTPIVIGLLLPPEQAESDCIRQGVLLAADQENEGSARKVSVIVRGRIGQWGADAVEAARMVLDDGVQGIIAPPDGAASHLALQVSGRTAVPLVSLCPDSSVSQTGVRWMVRAVPTTVEEAT